MRTYKNSPRKIYHTAQCAHCILEVALKYYKLAYTSSCNDKKNPDSINRPQDHRLDLELEDSQKLISFIAGAFDIDRSPNEIATDAFLAAKKLGQIRSGCEENGDGFDPWKEIRQSSNKAAMNLVGYAERTLDNIDDIVLRLRKAIQWSLVGNNLDFGTSGHSVDLDESSLMNLFDEIEKGGFFIDDFESLVRDLERYKHVLYLLDNAGEIAFDKLVINVLKEMGIKVVAVVKGGPISNDAIMADAVEVGLSDVCNVIDTGSPDLGFNPLHNDKNFIEIMENSPLIIAKGQANWEATYAYQHMLASDPIFYNILKVKCDVHADLLNCPKGAYILQKTTKSMFI